jgi:hypothetical protein
VIFVARGLVVSLAFFAVVYCSLSMLTALAWHIAPWIRKGRIARSAGLLFGLRMFAFVVSGVISVFFTFPSFWMMERAALDEDAGTFVLAACAVVIVCAGVFRLFRDQSRTTRAVRAWLLGAWNADGGATKLVLGAANGAPALILVGIRKPQVMVSDTATRLLSDEELRVAIRHELGHRRSWDNLKKVLLSATPFPGMGALERSWREAAELAADDAAVGNRQEALDLAAALIKLSRSPKPLPEPALASGLVCATSSIATRVERLLEWRLSGHRLQCTWPWTLVVLVIMTVAIASHYGATLVLTHRLTELLVP